MTNLIINYGHIQLVKKILIIGLVKKLIICGGEKCLKIYGLKLKNGYMLFVGYLNKSWRKIMTKEENDIK